MRLFVAVELSPSLTADLDRALEPLRDSAPGLAWAAAGKWHLTLKFIGEGDEPLAERIGGALDAVAGRHRSFSMHLNGIGAFPNFRRARVVWIGVAGDARLELLHHDLEVEAAAVGVEVEGRPFRPHVTIARLPAPPALDDARALARAARRIAFAATQEVTAITLFDSVPGPGGAHYRRVHTASLGGR